MDGTPDVAILECAAQRSPGAPPLAQDAVRSTVQRAAVHVVYDVPMLASNYTAVLAHADARPAPVNPVIEYESQAFDMVLKYESPYEGTPSPELEELWHDLHLSESPGQHVQVPFRLGVVDDRGRERCIHTQRQGAAADEPNRTRRRQTSHASER